MTTQQVPLGVPAPDPATGTPEARHGHDVFVSYSTGDKPVADAIVARLEQAGIRCWVAPRDVLPGTVWGEAIVKAIEAARLMVLVLSGAANESRQVVREVELAVSNNVVVVPFRIESVVPTGAMAYFLASEHWLDAMSPPLETHIAHLVGVAQALLGREAAQGPVAPPAAAAAAAAAPATSTVTASPAAIPAGSPRATWAGAGAGGRNRIIAGVAAGAIVVAALGGAWAAGIGPFGGGPGASPTVSPSSAAIATAQPSSTTTPSPEPTSDARYATVANDRALRAVVPMALQGSCDIEALMGQEIAAIQCPAPNTGGVVYEWYARTTDLQADWAAMLEANALTSGSGGCSDGKPGEGSWHFGTDSSPDEGRIACYLRGGTEPVLVWTDESIGVRTWINALAGTGIAAVHDRWRAGDFDPSRDVAALVLGVDGKAPVIPAAAGPECRRIAAQSPQLAAVRCTESDGTLVTYTSYKSAADLGADWATIRKANDLAVDSGGRCGDGVAGESSWSYESDPETTSRGRLLCATTGGGAVFAWTDTAALTRVVLEDSTIIDLRELWAAGSFDPVTSGS